MQYTRRLIWFIAGKLILICVLLGTLVCGFFMAMNVANINIVLEDGMEKRVDVMLTRQEAEELNKYFSGDFLRQDSALEDAINGNSLYAGYNITDYEYNLTIERLWAWPWDSYATGTVVERVTGISGKAVTTGRSADSIPHWQGGRYDVTLAKYNGQWKIAGMQLKTLLLEADEETTDLPSEVLLP